MRKEVEERTIWLSLAIALGAVMVQSCHTENKNGFDDAYLLVGDDEEKETKNVQMQCNPPDTVASPSRAGCTKPVCAFLPSVFSEFQS